MEKTDSSIDDLVRMAILEDVGDGDRTTEMLVDPELSGSGVVRAKEDLVVAGTETFLRVFQVLCPAITCVQSVADGDPVAEGGTVVELKGPYGALLTGERTALNFLQRLCGIATLTRRFVEKVKPFPAVILDTRKTTPGWRVLEKAAVRAGGGTNHRMGLFDGVLIKENHISACGGIRPAVERARQEESTGLKIEVEVRSLDELREALEAGPDMIMLDNMPCSEVKQAVMEVAGRVPLEASGNITLETIERVAATGVNYISSGTLTHSAPAADLSMIIEPDHRP